MTIPTHLLSGIASRPTWIPPIGILPSGDDIASKIWDLLFGAVAEAIENAVDTFLGFGIEVFFTVENPYGHDAAFQAWMDSFEVALAIFPIMIILGLLSMPFADEQKTSLWRQGLRAVGVIVLIALSRPLMGFGVDLANILTHALMPDGGDLLDLMNPMNQMGNAIGLGLVYVLLGTKFFLLAAIAMLVTLLLLQFRTFMVYVVYIMSPLLAVFWYADWGLLESIHEFANKFARMGIYSLLVGPIVAVIYRTLLVIGLSGFSSDFGSAEWVSAIWSQLVMTLLLPFLLIATVWKLISWAGEPLGVGNAITGALVAAGAALTAGTGALGGLAGGAGAGGGGAAGAGAGGGAGGAGAGASAGGAGAGPSASSMAQSAGGGGGSVGSGSSSSGGVGASGSATTANGGSLSDVVDDGQTVSSSESEPAGGVSSGPGGGTGKPGGGPSDSATGMDDNSPSEPKGYAEGASERYQNWKSRNAQRIKDSVKKGYEGAKDKLNPTNLQRRQAQKHRDAAQNLQENKEQFNDSVDWNAGEHGEVDLNQANEAGALDANPAEGQDTAQLTEDGQFEYMDENGELQETSVGTTRGQFDESIEQHQQRAEQHEQRADSIDEALSKQEGRMKKTAANQRKRQQAAGSAFFKEGVRGTIGAHSPYLMQSSGGGYGGNNVGGVSGPGGGGGGGGVPNAGSQPAGEGGEGGMARPEHNITPEQANEHSEMLSESGERFDLDREVGYEPTGGSTPDGVAQQGKIVDPESGDAIMDVEVGEDADFSLSQDETTRLGNVGVRETADGTKRLHADGNSRTFEENEMRGDEFIGNDDAAGQEATFKGATLREAPGEAESYEGQYVAEMPNGEMIPVNAEDEEMDQHLQEHVGETGDLNGVVSREYGMSEDAHETHQGAHEYNALNVNSTSKSEAGAGEGEGAGGEAGGSDGSGGSGGSGETAQASSGFGLYNEGGPSESNNEQSVNNTLSPSRLNRGNANPTINNDRAVEGNVVEDENGGHALEDENTGERLNSEDINDPNNNITNGEGEFQGDVEAGDQARVENVRVGADGSSIEATESSEVTNPAAEESEAAGGEGSGEASGESDEGASSEGGSSTHEEEGGGGQASSNHGFSPADDGRESGGGSGGGGGGSGSRSTTSSASSSGHGFESASEEGGSESGGGSGGSPGSGPDTVSAEELVQADDSQEDLPYKTSPEGQWVYEDTWNQDEIEQDMYDGSDASADDVIAARGVLHEADGNGNIQEDGASVGYVRFGSEHGLDESPAPEINGEKRDPNDGEVVEFGEDSGVKTRQWATEEGFNFSDSRVQESSGIEHGGEEGAVTAFSDGEEVKADPENQYIQVVPDEDSKLSSAGTTESPGRSSSGSAGGSASAEAESASTESASSSSAAGEAAGRAEEVESGGEGATTTDVSGSAEFEDGRVQHEDLEGAESREDLNGKTADVEGTVGTNEYGNPTIEGEDSSAPLTDTTQSGAPELGSGKLENVNEGDSISANDATIETGGENDTVALSEESEVNTKEAHEGGVSVDFGDAESHSETDAADSRSSAEGGSEESSGTVVDDTVSESVNTPEADSEETTIESGSQGGSASEDSETSEEAGSGGESGEETGFEGDPFVDTGGGSGGESTGTTESNESAELSSSETQHTEEPTESVEGGAGEPAETGREESSIDLGETGSHQSPEIEENEPEIEKGSEESEGGAGEPESEEASGEESSGEGASQSEIEESISEINSELDESGGEAHSEGEVGGSSEPSEETGASFEGDPFADIGGESGSEESTTVESSSGVDHEQEINQEGGEYESGNFESGDVELGDREDGDFETGDVEQRETHEEGGDTTASHASGVEQNIEPETASESEVVEESEEPEEPEEGEEADNEGEDGDDENGDGGEGGGASSSDDDDHDGGGSGNLSSGGEKSDASATESASSGSTGHSGGTNGEGHEASGESHEADGETEAAAGSEHEGEAEAEAGHRVTESSIDTEIDHSNTEGISRKEGATEVLDVEEREKLHDELVEEHGEEAVDEVYGILDTRKKSSEFHPNEVAKGEKIGNEALDTDHPLRQEIETNEDSEIKETIDPEVSEEEAGVYRDLVAESNEFVEENLENEDGEAIVHRGMSHRGAAITTSLIDDPEAESVELPEQEQSIAYSTEEDVAEHFAERADVPVVAERDVSDEDVLAVDAVGYKHDGPEELTNFDNQSEGEIHVIGQEEVETENLRFAGDDEADSPGEVIKNATENPEEASQEDHEKMDFLVRRLNMDGEAPETKEGAERLKRWGEHVHENPDLVPDAEMTTYSVESTLEEADVDVDHEIVEQEGSGSEDGEDDGAEIL